MLGSNLIHTQLSAGKDARPVVQEVRFAAAMAESSSEGPSCCTAAMLLQCIIGMAVARGVLRCWPRSCCAMNVRLPQQREQLSQENHSGPPPASHLTQACCAVPQGFAMSGSKQPWRC